jgi:hypothetical protein
MTDGYEDDPISRAYAEKIVVGSGESYRAAVDDAWEKAKRRGLVRETPGEEGGPTGWIRIVEIYAGGVNPITEYRVVADGTGPPPSP